MIEIEGLKKRFGQSIALDEVSMHVRDGAMYGFVGPNGAGKTTTIRCMMGLLAADGGKLLINGIDMEKSEVCTDIGIIDEGKVVLEAPIDDILNQINVSRQLVISVSGDQTTALKILRSHPCVETITIRQEDMVVGFTGNRQDEIMLLQQLVDAEVMVYGFARERGSLESVFMQITGHEEERMVLLHEDESGI